jgi:hypothetical protein
LLENPGYVLETPGGLVITQHEGDGLADEILVCDGKALSTVQADWPVDEWPQVHAIGDTLVLIDGGDVWIGEMFED